MTEVIGIQPEPTIPAQTPAPETEPTGWMNTNGDFGQGAPENIQTLLNAKKWTNVEQLVDNYIKLEKQQGVHDVGNYLVMPKEGELEQWEGWSKLGRPETYDKYVFEEDPDIPFGNEILDRFKQGAHKQGFNQNQASWVLDLQRDIIKEATIAEKAQIVQREEENISAMKTKWGEVNYDATIKGVDITAEKLGVLEFFRSMGIDKEPEIVNMLLTITNSDKEDTIDGQQPLTAPDKTLFQELEEIKKSEAYMKRFHPDHKATMVRYMKLNQDIANSGQSKAPR